MEEKIKKNKEFIVQITKTIPSLVSSILEPIIFILLTLKEACDKLAKIEEEKKEEEKVQEIEKK